MYSESDIDAAVAAGVLRAEDAGRLRAFVAEDHRSSAVDEEHFRLITGFNDIFVTIAATLLLAATGWIAGRALPAAGGLAVAVVAWGLAEYFTRTRRMALPSILLLAAFVLGLLGFAAGLLFDDGRGVGFNPADAGEGSIAAVKLAAAAALAAAGAWAHWRRFHVPITIAAGAAAAAAVAVALTVALVPRLAEHITTLMLLAGIAIFALAMRWDMSDPARETRRSDVAFWLHLLAAPLIVHPVFALLGLLGGDAGLGGALVVILLYVVLGLLALAIDRRAPMVSALAYVLYALSIVFREAGAAGLNIALTGLVLGSALLLLSAFWHTARAAVVARLPEGLRARLPVLGRTATTA